MIAKRDTLMNMRFSFLLVAFLFLAPFAFALESDKAYTDRRVKQVEDKVSNLKTQDIQPLSEKVSTLEAKVDQQEKALDEQSAKIKELIDSLNETRSLLDDKLAAIEQLKTDADGTQTKANLMFWILLPVASMVLLFLGFFLWPRKTQSAGSALVFDTGRPKCPRCGWEHDPGDTVCKNPACRTQF